MLVRLKDEGRRLGIVSAKRRSTVELAFARVPLGHLFDVVVGGDETERQKPDPEPLLLALDRLGAEPADAAYVGDSPYDMQAARAAGLYAVGVTWGGIHEPRRSPTPTSSSHTRGGAACRPLTPAARAAELREPARTAGATRTTSSTTPRSTTRPTTATTTSSSRSRREHPELVTPDSPTQRVGAPPSERFRKVAAPRRRWARSRR